MKTATKIEFRDHGIMWEQYFQGCGVAFTEFTDCFTGIGVDAISALEDALDQVAVSGIEIPLELENEAMEETEFDDSVVPEDSEDAYYYVSVRVKVGGQ